MPPAPIVPVILCGGSGTRLWPLSRDGAPKQFAPLVGERSTFQLTLERVAAPHLFRKPIVVANHAVRFTAAEQIQALGLEAELVLEPAPRDSAPAVAVGALMAQRQDPDAAVAVLAADHLFGDPNAFLAACEAALPAVERGFIMTLGVQPNHPATGYGYIQPGEPIAGTAARRIARFVEKPGSGTARAYLDAGYLWNNGNFLFRADVMLRELERFAPDVLAAAAQALDGATRDLDFLRLEPDAFARAPRISIDYAVMERTDSAGVLPVRFAWSDVGSWGGLWSVLPHDADGNAVRGDAQLIDTRGSLVHSEDTLTTVVGLEDVVVVTTPDAVLVAARGTDTQVKSLVETLRAQGRREVATHRRVHRPWGWYQCVDEGSRFQVKRILVKPGARLSLQLHFHRAEHWVVVRGTAEVTVGDKLSLLQENEAAYIPLGSPHRLANPGRIPLELIEVQVGTYTGEDDIVRLEDMYNRV